MQAHKYLAFVAFGILTSQRPRRSEYKMKALNLLPCLALSAPFAFASNPLYARQSKYGGGGGYQTSSQNPSTGSENSTTTGDSSCSSSMCVAAQVNGNTVQYTLTSQRDEVGWMAIGFGSQMTRSPMVIMWANEDGSLTLSQRQANSYVEPAVVPSPPRVAEAQVALSATSGSDQRYVFTIPANNDRTQTIVWAFGDSKPASAAVDARLFQHVDQGRMTLDLTRTSGGEGDAGDNNDSEDVPLTSSERTLLAHAVLATVGFLVILPIGALIPRYLRTFVGGWFKFHWIVQFILGGLASVIGIILGIVAVSNRGGVHVNSTHKRVGIVLLALYAFQVSLGAIIHFFKPKSWTAGGRRPAQNYIHAIVGLLIIALALFQVRTGYRSEWPRVMGRPAAQGINILWYIWVALLPVLYFAGLALLPKQFKQERKGRERVPA